MKSRIVKVITVLVFLGLVLGFVVYKAGYFKKEGVLSDLDFSQELSDTTKKDSLAPAPMMSSSKSLTISDKSLFSGDSSRKSADTSTNAAGTSGKSKTKVDSTSKVNPMMYSSKSALILKPGEWKFNFDSLLIDTLKNK